MAMCGKFCGQNVVGTLYIQVNNCAEPEENTVKGVFFKKLAS